MNLRLWTVVAALACASGSALAANDQLVPEGCVILGKSRKVSSMCEFKKNTPMFYTPIKTSGAQGCPKSLIVLYRDPQTGKILSHAALRQNTVIETCTAGVSRVAIKPGQAIIRSDKDSRKPSGKNGPSGRLDGITISYSYRDCSSSPCLLVAGTMRISGNTLTGEAGGVKNSIPIGGKVLDGRTDSSHGCATRTDYTYEASVTTSQIITRTNSTWKTNCKGKLVDDGNSTWDFIIDVNGNTCSVRGTSRTRQTHHEANGSTRDIPNKPWRITNVKCAVQ